MEQKRFPELEPYIKIVLEKIEKDGGYNEFSKITLGLENLINSLKKIDDKEILPLIIEGLAFFEKYEKEKDFFNEKKELLEETIKIGKTIQNDLKKEVGKFVMKGEKNSSKILQAFSYAIFEKVSQIKPQEKKDIKKDSEEYDKHFYQRKVEKRDKKTYKIKVIKKEKRSGAKKLLFYLLIFSIILLVLNFALIRKGEKVKEVLQVSDFEELPEGTKFYSESHRLENLDEKRKKNLTREVVVKAEEKGYLLVNFKTEEGKIKAKWIKGERIYFYGD